MRHTSLMHASKIATCVIVLAVSALVAGERHRMTEERSKELFEEAIRAAAAAQGSKLQVIVQPHSHDDGMVVIPCVFGFFSRLASVFGVCLRVSVLRQTYKQVFVACGFPAVTRTVGWVRTIDEVRLLVLRAQAYSFAFACICLLSCLHALAARLSVDRELAFACCCARQPVLGISRRSITSSSYATCTRRLSTEWQRTSGARSSR